VNPAAASRIELEAIEPDANQSSPGWVVRLIEALQPLSLRADRLGSTALFAGYRWSDLERMAALFEDVEVSRGTRLTVQGRADSRLWLIVEGEALVSADARPLRVAGHGDALGVAGMLYSIASPETTIALGEMRALAAGRSAFADLVSDYRIRRRLTAVAGAQVRSRRLAKLR
jgi:CRP-like cAMP-binding protein